MPLIKPHPRCGARTRSGGRCRRYVAVDPWTKRLRKRCRNHGGLSTGPKFFDGKERSLAAANAGLARGRERMRAAKAAGLIAKFPCGRKPGPTRQQRELEAYALEEALARRRVEFRDAHGRPRWPACRGGSSLVVDLERLERTFITRCRDFVPPPDEVVETMYARILRYEEVIGRTNGKEERLACVSWAYDNWRTRKMVKKVVAELEQQREARVAQTSAPASNASATPTLDRPPLTDSTPRVEASEPLADDDDEAAALAQLTAEAAELIAALKALYTESGCQSLDEQLARARGLVKIKAEVTERALRTAEIDLCRHKLEMIRASQAANEAIKARYHASYLRREVKRARERERGVPIIMPGVGPLRRLP